MTCLSEQQSSRDRVQSLVRALTSVGSQQMKHLGTAGQQMCSTMPTDANDGSLPSSTYHMTSAGSHTGCRSFRTLTS